MKRVLAVAAAAMIALSSGAFGQSAPEMKIAVGGKGGTYWPMFQQMNQLCGESITMLPQETSGSIENVDLLSGNKVNGGMVQSDVLWLRQQAEPRLASVKTLVALHPEEVHIIALAESKRIVGGRVVFGKNLGGGSPAVFESIGDLAGYPVAAWGGSTTTAQAIQLLAGIPYTIVDAVNQNDAIGKLRNGDVDAVIAVGGAPMTWVGGLNKEFKLLTVPEAIRSKLDKLYSPASLTYSNLGATDVRTVSTDALLVTREYKTKRYVEGLSKLRACITENLPELQETLDNHPKWQDVKAGNKGKLPWYELPAP